MIVKIISFSIKGINSVEIIIEVSVSPGLAKFEIIGLPDTAIKESKERIFKAIQENQYKVPPGNITINLAPAKIKKRGPLYDLPITLGILIASRQIKVQPTKKEYLIAGELSLNGDVRGIEGLFVAILQNLTKQKKYSYIFPTENIKNLTPLSNKGSDFFPVNSLQETIQVLNGETPSPLQTLITINNPPISSEKKNKNLLDYREVMGNRQAKIALQLAVINRLNVLLIGPPGCGKTMLIERMPTILPPLNKEDSFLVTKIHSAKNTNLNYLMVTPPFRTVHNTIHSASLIGGGKYPEPGEITLAHKGFLFMDELSEFDKSALQSLRTPLEKKNIQINRIEDQVNYPSDFVLLACTNPCPCGYYGDDERICQCSETMINRFYTKISGPILDRFDIMLFIHKFKPSEFDQEKYFDSTVMKNNVLNALQRKQKIKNPFANKTMKEIFNENQLLKELMFKANQNNFFSLRKFNASLKTIYALMLYYNLEEINRDIILDTIEYCRVKLS